MLAHTIEPTHQHSIELNQIKGNALKICGARDPKGNKEINCIPKNLLSPRRIPKNSGISFPPHNANQSQTNISPQYQSSTGASQSLYAMVIMSQILLEGTQSNLVNPNNLCHNPTIKEQCKRR